MGDGTFSQVQVGAGFNKITLSKKVIFCRTICIIFATFLLNFFVDYISIGCKCNTKEIRYAGRINLSDFKWRNRAE